MFEQIKRIFKVLSDDKELFTTTSKIYYNMYQSLVEVGFTEEQAIKIVCSHSVLPTNTGKNKGISEI